MSLSYDPGALVSVGDAVFHVIDVPQPGVLHVAHHSDGEAIYRIRAPRPSKSWLLLERLEI